MRMKCSLNRILSYCQFTVWLCRFRWILIVNISKNVFFGNVLTSIIWVRRRRKFSSLNFDYNKLPVRQATVKIGAEQTLCFRLTNNPSSISRPTAEIQAERNENTANDDEHNTKAQIEQRRIHTLTVHNLKLNYNIINYIQLKIWFTTSTVL